MADEKRLIDANKLIDELVEKQFSEQTMGIVASCYPQMRAIVANQPTVDAVELVHGQWSRDGNWNTCSECGFFYLSSRPLYNYCPNCGARMDLEVSR